MASFTFKFPQQPFSYCKYTSPLNHSNICPSYISSTKLTLKLETRATRLETDQEISRITRRSVNHTENGSGFSSFSPKVNMVGRKFPTNNHAEENVEKWNGLHPLTSSSGKKDEKGKRVEQKSRKSDDKEQKEKRCRKSKLHSPEGMLRVGLEMCTKRGDVLSAIKLYELAKKEAVKMDEYHYSVLLYLCSSAATGILRAAKSGTGGRSLNPPESKEVNGLVLDSNSEKEFSFDATLESSPQSLDEFVQLMMTNAKSFGVKDYIIQVSQEVKSFALEKGLKIFDLLRSEKVPMNEATFTSAARLAMSLGDGDMAFGLVKQMKEFGITPRLRSYGPALHCFCNCGDVEKAFMIESHMMENGVCPEEPELEELLKVSVEAERSDKVYYVLHKLRMSVRQVSPSTAHLIEKWFHGNAASRVGKRKWDQKLIWRAIENGGGGWHGQGWLGNGKWKVSHTSVGSDGFCKCCGEQLVTIDLDPEETENFAKSVASIAAQREKKSNFQKFQKWLDYYGPFEAVIDGANAGLFNQRNFKPSKVNAIANGIREMLPSKKWPLVILHNRRVAGDNMRRPFDKALVEKWRTADALYETPTGSNDDWYWLYAAIKSRCLIVTNDEMRDHLFQLLGNDFFPKWKERHQVHFSFSEIGPVFHMPPPCSIVIQESEKGHWHIPIVLEHGSEGERVWLCVTRGTNTVLALKNSPNIYRESEVPSPDVTRGKCGESSQQEAHLKLKRVLQTLSPNQSVILQELDAAEMLGNCIIDFQI